MIKWVVGLLTGVGVLVAGAAIYVWIANAFFSGHIERLREQMIETQLRPGSGTAELPEIVRAYAIKAGAQVGGNATFYARHEATLATSTNAAPLPLQAEQWTGIIAPGIVWVAHGSMNGLPVTVIDAYVDGQGELSARVLGSFQVAGGSGPDYDKGELMRYLSELPVYPDAILNNVTLRWKQIDALTVEVTAASRSGPASIRFYFDDQGDIVRMEADDRPMTAENGTTVPTPWHGLYRDYRQFGRYRVPTYGEVGWLLSGGLFTYWRGKVVAYEPQP